MRGPEAVEVRPAFQVDGRPVVETGALQGIVNDAAGKPLEKAQVLIEYTDGINRKYEVKTNKKGEFIQIGLQPGDRWCLHVLRWIEAWEAGRAPKVVLEATHESVLKLVPLQALKRHALETH